LSANTYNNIVATHFRKELNNKEPAPNETKYKNAQQTYIRIVFT